MKMLRNVIDWLEHRTGIESAINHFLYEDVPASAGWHQVLGSVALFAFLTQVFTGILLAVNYAPTPGEAYSSLRYIVTELTGGQLIRGLHHWGASLMIIVVVLHMLQVFLWGAYKKPREATWMVGALLLLLTLAYGLTGYLLPWDNRAYWATTVTVHISALPPIAGPYVLRLLGSDGGSIGAVTFARFYAAHVLLLPPLTLLLVALHVYLVRRHGVTPIEADAALPKKKFYPEQVFKDTVATFVWFAILAGMAIAVRVPLGHVADPTDFSFTPRPEWYFLFLFQFVKLFNGPLEVVGAVIIPTVAMLVLILMPFIDRGKMVRLRERTGAIAVIVLAVIGWSALTAAAVATTPPSTESADAGFAEIEPWQQMPADQLAAIGAFRKDNCGSCHVLGKSGAGPDLTRAVSKRPNDWLMQHFKQPAPNVTTQLKNPELRNLVTFITKRDDKAAKAWSTAPQTEVEGAMVYQANQCSACHKLNAVGMEEGPALNGVGERRSREWIEGHFADPPKFSAGSTMPPYKFSSHDLDRITTYIMEIPK